MGELPLNSLFYNCLCVGIRQESVKSNLLCPNSQSAIGQIATGLLEGRPAFLWIVRSGGSSYRWRASSKKRFRTPRPVFSMAARWGSVGVAPRGRTSLHSLASDWSISMWN